MTPLERRITNALAQHYDALQHCMPQLVHNINTISTCSDAYWEQTLDKNQASAIVLRAFLWLDAPEGDQFWIDIYNELVDKGL